MPKPSQSIKKIPQKGETTFRTATNQECKFILNNDNDSFTILIINLPFSRTVLK